MTISRNSLPLGSAGLCCFSVRLDLEHAAAQLTNEIGTYTNMRSGPSPGNSRDAECGSMPADAVLLLQQHGKPLCQPQRGVRLLLRAAA